VPATFWKEERKFWETLLENKYGTA